MAATLLLTDEIAAALATGTEARRSRMLSQLTELFLLGAPSFTAESIALFDQVMEHLIGAVERFALIRLSLQLAPVDNAPPRTVDRLAASDDIAVAGPMIEKSRRVTEAVLVEIATQRSIAHLAAIATRNAVAEAVTDPLVERADLAVTRKIARNIGAHFSEAGFRAMVGRAYDDGELAEILAGRSDMPAELFRDLVQRATEIVRQRLIRSAEPTIKAKIEEAIRTVGRHLVQAHRAAATVQSGGVGSTNHLKSELCRQAKAGDRAATISAITGLTGVPPGALKVLVKQAAEEDMLMVCRAAGLGWADAKTVVAVVLGRPGEPRGGFDRYVAISADEANRAVSMLKKRK